VANKVKRKTKKRTITKKKKKTAPKKKATTESCETVEMGPDVQEEVCTDKENVAGGQPNVGGVGESNVQTDPQQTEFDRTVTDPPQPKEELDKVNQHLIDKGVGA